jgi:hypothetical protein
MRNDCRIAVDPLMVQLAAPYDDETMTSLIETTKLMGEGASTPA